MRLGESSELCCMGRGWGSTGNVGGDSWELCWGEAGNEAGGVLEMRLGESWKLCWGMLSP